MSRSIAKSVLLELSDLFKDFDSDFDVNPSYSSSSGIQVFDISKKIDGYSSKDTHLGKPHLLSQYVSYVRESAFWLAPRTGGKHFSLDRLGVLTIFERSDGVHVGVLPSSGTSDLCTSGLKSTGHGGIVLHTENDSKSVEDKGQRVFVAYGLEFELVVQALFDISKSVIFGDDEVEKLMSKVSLVDKTASWKTEWFDGLMYCTWNGLGPVLSHDLIINALTDLDSSGVKISGIIIDDGWQHTNQYRQLYDLRADEFRFPHGLKGLVKEIHKKFPYIKDIGVWSTLIGYWEGVVRGSELDELYKTVDCKMKNGKSFRIINSEEAPRFYDEYFKSLADAGITCVKIDYQAVIDDIHSHEIRGDLYPAYQESLFNSSLKYFNGKVIYCMAMVQNIMLYSLQRSTYNEGSKRRPVPVFRNSNDFFPTILSSHFWHIYVNLYNTVYTGNLYSIPDFDMFQSKLQAGGEEPLATRVTSLHAAARCISGGPIYFTDSPYKHDLDLIKSFSSPSRSNQRVVLRPTGVARPVFPYQPFDAEAIHWGYNYSEFTELPKGDGKPSVIYSIILAAFNISYDEVTQAVNWDNFIMTVKPGISATVSDDLILRSYKTGTLWSPNDKNASVSLLSGEWDIVSAAPLIPVPSKPVQSEWVDIDRPAIAFFGLLDNICGIAGVHSYEIEAKSTSGGSLGVRVWLKALGVLGVYTTFPVDNVTAIVDGKPVNKSRITNGKLLKIDVTYEGLIEGYEKDKEELVLVEISLS